jgi:hypothetical protein
MVLILSHQNIVKTTLCVYCTSEIRRWPQTQIEPSFRLDCLERCLEYKNKNFVLKSLSVQKENINNDKILIRYQLKTKIYLISN